MRAIILIIIAYILQLSEGIGKIKKNHIINLIFQYICYKKGNEFIVVFSYSHLEFYLYECRCILVQGVDKF